MRSDGVNRDFETVSFSRRLFDADHLGFLLSNSNKKEFWGSSIKLVELGIQ